MDSQAGKIPPPAGLSTASRRLWAELVTDVAVVTDGRPAASSLVLIEEVLRARDRLAEIRETLATDGVTVVGSRGQTRPHPLLAIERQLVAEISNGLARLELRPSRIRGMRDFQEARALTRD
jgi:hypothetical protein